MKTEKELMEYLAGKAHVYLYGAGVIGQRLSRRMEKYKICPEGYIVTKKEENPSYIHGRKVWEAKELVDSGICMNQVTVIIALATGNQELAEDLLDMGYKNILLPLPDLLTEIRGREWEEEYNQCGNDYILDYDYPCIERRHLAVVEKKTGRALFRTLWSRNAGTVLKESGSLRIFEQLYGPYCKLPYTKSGNTDVVSNGLEVYVVTSHLNKKEAKRLKEKEWEIPIQAGAALTSERRGYLTDDTGDHISEENRNYCECTALYWIWKNTDGQDYVGLCQYRRRFRLEESSIRYMREQDVDAVAVLPQFNYCTNKDFFSKYGFRHDWEYWKEAVIGYDAAYETVIDRYEQSHFFIPCNMVIFKREWFDRYCEFAFSAASMIDKRYKEALVIPREDRYMGYLFENMLSVFLIRNHEYMKTAYTDMIFI